MKDRERGKKWKEGRKKTGEREREKEEIERRRNKEGRRRRVKREVEIGIERNREFEKGREG